MILVVSTEESSTESSGVDESLEQVFAAASSVKSLVVTSMEMETDKMDLEDFITKAEAEIELNTVELIQRRLHEAAAGEPVRALQGLLTEVL